MEVALQLGAERAPQPLHERAAQAIEALFADQLDDHLQDWRIITAAAAMPARRSTICGLPASRRPGAALMKRRQACLIPRSKCSRASLKVRSRCDGKSSCGLLSSDHWLRTTAMRRPEVDESARRALELSGALGDPRLHFPALMFAWAFHQVRRDLGRADQTSMELIELAERAREPGMIANANFASGAVSLFSGKFRAARARLQQAAAILVLRR